MLFNLLKKYWNSPVGRVRIYFILCGFMIAVGLLVVLPWNKGVGNAIVMLFSLIAGGLFARYRTAVQEEEELRKNQPVEDKKKDQAKKGNNSGQKSNIREMATRKLKDRY